MILSISLNQQSLISHSSKPMDNFEISKILDTFEIIVDTREQTTNRSIDRYNQFGVPWKRQTLDYGDYSYNVKIDGKNLLTGRRIKGLCVIERKQNLDELATCLTRGRDRFEREFMRASDNNARCYLLIENGSWELLIKGRYRSKFKPKAFLASLAAWQVRYGLNVVFCDMSVSGILIKEILYRDIKERLERGEFG